MCGICGILQQGSSVPEPVGRRMLRTLAHRGPDGEGLGAYARGPLSVLLGSRRLAIIDLSPAGDQPILNEDGSVALVFNGEIYNFQALREDLLARGHRFRSRTDAEVIVHGYEAFGDEVVGRLDGMFAFALWDGRAGRLLLARDRMGKKPLYLYGGDGVLVFASEIKALLAHPAVPVEADPAVLPEYLVHGYLLGTRTFYRGIVQLPPASTLIADAAGVHPPRAYWRLTFPPAGEERQVDEDEASETVRGLLDAGVRRRLISDVPLGALLSGGLDSSIIAALMAAASPERVRTFSAGLAGDASYDERPHARAVADWVGTQHTEFEARADGAGLFDDLLWHHDQPYGDSSALPTYLISGLTRRGVTVALAGDGGDEVFAGYERFRAALLAERVPRPMARPLGALLRLLPEGRGYYSRLTRLRRFGAGVAEPLARRYLEWVAVTPPRLAAVLLNEELGRDVGQVVAGVEAITAAAGDAHPLHRLLHLNFTTYLPGDLLVKMDRMSMAQSLETRSPFLDLALVEYAASLPPRLKIRGGRGKALLRRAFRDRLPPAILRRGKHGFGVPLDAWFRGALRPWLVENLLPADARINAYFRPGAPQRLVRRHLAGRENHGHRLWTLLMLERWLRLLPSWPQRAGRHG
jgi:asparagine synthase (glutamine-hydrolysing)